MCNCSSSVCGCATVKGRRGPRGLDGPAGDAGTGAQILSGDGPPSADPTPVTAYVLYEDTATGGNWYIWTPGSPGAWTDTGVPVSGADGTDGGNAYSISSTTFAIPAAGQVSMLQVLPTNDPAFPNSSGTDWMVDFDSGSGFFGQTIFIQGAGEYRVAGKFSNTQVAVINRRNDATGEYLSNPVSGTIAAGARVSPGGLQGPAGIPVEVTSGAPNPTVDPAGGASGLYVQSGSGGTYWYFDGPSGPWTDTGIDVTGPQGAVGPGGANGYSPLPTTGTLAPSGGNDGDFYFRQVNPGLLQLYTRAAGVWVAGITVVANRLIGYSEVSATPNPSNLPVNVGDYYWSYVAGRLIFSVCSVAGTPGTWVTAINILMTGGSGAPVDAEYIVASSNATLSNERVANSTATIVPDTTVAGQMRWNVPDDGITNAKLNNVPSNTFKGLSLGGPANPIDMTADQASTVLDTATDPFVRTSAIPGGTSTFQSISDGSPVLGDGRQTGTNVWTMQRSIQYQPRTLTIVSPLTTNLDTDYQWQRISINVVSFTLGWTGLGIDQNCEWIFEFTNDYIDAGSGLPAQTHLTYDAGRWTKNAGITQPSYINPGEVVTLHCFQRDGKMNITCVEQGVTAI